MFWIVVATEILQFVNWLEFRHPQVKRTVEREWTAQMLGHDIFFFITNCYNLLKSVTINDHQPSSIIPSTICLICLFNMFIGWPSTIIPSIRFCWPFELRLGRPLRSVFAFLDPTPLASASIAQVHAGRLLDGTEVVIKAGSGSGTG